MSSWNWISPCGIRIFVKMWKNNIYFFFHPRLKLYIKPYIITYLLRRCMNDKLFQIFLLEGINYIFPRIHNNMDYILKYGNGFASCRMKVWKPELKLRVWNKMNNACKLWKANFLTYPRDIRILHSQRSALQALILYSRVFSLALSWTH